MGTAGEEGREAGTGPLHCCMSHFEAEHRHPGNTGWGVLQH